MRERFCEDAQVLSRKRRVDFRWENLIDVVNAIYCIHPVVTQILVYDLELCTIRERERERFEERERERKKKRGYLYIKVA